MRITSILKFPQSFQEFEKIKSLKKPKPKSIVDLILWMHKERDFTFKSLRKNFEKHQLDTIKIINQFDVLNFGKLGAELHAASYVLKIAGKCRLHGSSKWLELGNNNLKDLLPEEKTNDLFVEGLNFSKSIIQYGGLTNIEECLRLNTLIFDDCYFFDDFCIRSLVHSFANSLINLDISNCSKITDDGLMSLGYLKNLKRLNLSNLINAKNKEYIAVLLEENNPNLVITGLDHLSEQTLKNVEQNMNKEILEFEQIKQNKNKEKQSK